MTQTYGSDDTGAVGADETGLVLGLQDVGDADHVCCDSVSVYLKRAWSIMSYRAGGYPQ